MTQYTKHRDAILAELRALMADAFEASYEGGIIGVVPETQETPMPEFKIGDRVIVKHDGYPEWNGEGVVCSSKSECGGNYTVEMETGDRAGDTGAFWPDHLTHVTAPHHPPKVSERGQDADCSTCRHNPGAGSCKPFRAGTCVGENSWAGYEPKAWDTVDPVWIDEAGTLTPEMMDSVIEGLKNETYGGVQPIMTASRLKSTRT
jgi:hypothetical protein